MIGKIKGTLVEVNENSGLIETPSGVFYEVYLPPSFLGRLLPAPIEVYTYLQVREDAHVLFGFASKSEHTFFKLLIGISGVGPKTAFSIMSFSKTDELIQAVKQNDVAFFTRVPGLGKKTAMKIILELSEKVKSEFKLEQMYFSDEDKTVIDALTSLGFSSQEVKNIMPKLTKDSTLELKIKEGIKILTAHKK